MESVQSGDEESPTPVSGEWNSMKEKIDSHERGIAVISEKLDLLLRGQARMATELTDGPRSPVGRSVQPPIGSSGSGIQNREEINGYGGRRSEFRPRNIELPVFSGSDPDDWTFRAERYFGLQRLTAEEQLEAAILCLEGPALRWFRWENRRREIRGWAELKDLLLRRFLPAHEGSVYDRFLALQQTTTVQEYRQQFEALATSLGTVAEPLLESAFMKGLSEDIQGTLRLLEPIGLEKTMEMAEMVEANPKVTRAFYAGPKGGGGPIKGVGTPIANGFNSNNTNGPRIGPNTKGSGVTTGSPNGYRNPHSFGQYSRPSSTTTAREPNNMYRRLTETEIQEKRARGVCYKCDGPWSRSHRCKSPELQIILVQEGAMFSEYVEEKRDLIRSIPKNRKLSDLPKISQPTLIIWGEHDQVFPLELAHRLKRHLGDNAELVVIKNSGHVFFVEKPKEFYKHLKSFLLDPHPNLITHFYGSKP
ncbi:hypothetical protein F8388_019448 [Cannabis sativa]|uniref:Retrotransposon gag domain-containing protein n=1 Tax=Cannabis sativa TaxID=3483 RepID=A0A7J6EPJ5_CANSA|nr:hypothetical protein F8388_019448 [Cannabis sativa]